MVVDNNKKLVKPKLVNIRKGGHGGNPGPGRPPKTPPTSTPAMVPKGTTAVPSTKANSGSTITPNNNKWILPPPPIPKMSQITITNNSENSVNSTLLSFL